MSCVSFFQGTIVPTFNMPVHDYECHSQDSARLMQARGCKRNFSQFLIVPLHTETDIINAFHTLVIQRGTGNFSFFWPDEPVKSSAVSPCFTGIFRRAPDVAHGQVPNQVMVRLHQGCRRDPRPPRLRSTSTGYDCGGFFWLPTTSWPWFLDVFSMILEKWLAKKK